MFLELKPLRTRPGFRTDPLGRGTDLVHVDFMVGEHGPFVITIPRDEFSNARARDEMQKLALELNLLHG